MLDGLGQLVTGLTGPTAWCTISSAPLTPRVGRIGATAHGVGDQPHRGVDPADRLGQRGPAATEGANVIAAERQRGPGRYGLSRPRPVSLGAMATGTPEECSSRSVSLRTRNTCAVRGPSSPDPTTMSVGSPASAARSSRAWGTERPEHPRWPRLARHLGCCGEQHASPRMPSAHPPPRPTSLKSRSGLPATAVGQACGTTVTACSGILVGARQLAGELDRPGVVLVGAERRAGWPSLVLVPSRLGDLLGVGVGVQGRVARP